MRRQLLPALVLVALSTLVCGLAYPLFVTGIAQVAFPAAADGSLVERDGEVVGSSLLGQEFTGEEWFQARPSAAGAAASGSYVEVLDEDGEPTGEVEAADPDDLADASSGGSNLGPTSEELLTTVEERAVAYREANGLPADAEVPVDAVTASASGLDRHISVANARLQAPRVAEVRGLDEAEVLALVDEHTEGRSLGFLGEPGVNVLELNLALDELDGESG
ncbi:potassium-transporting ATPase subunit C [cyanobacterium TDX16]|nr:potassium-transporting ATPase subunit C [cyanobacterium TDX16]